MEREKRGCARNVAAGGVAISLGSTAFNAGKGMYLSHQLGGLERVSSIGSQVLAEVQKLNINEALYVAALYPNEMSAVLSFGIAAICGLAAAGSMLGYAYYEANHE